MSEYVERIFLHNFSETSIIKTVLNYISYFYLVLLLFHKEISMNTYLFGRPPPES